MIIRTNAGRLTRALNDAARVAPNKGAAFDAAAGLLLHAHDDRLEVRATDLDTTFQEWVPCEGDSKPFRVPDILAGIVATFDSEQTVEIDSVPTGCVVSCDGFRAELNYILGDYPNMPAFEWGNWTGTPVSDFSYSIKRVVWGAGRRGETPIDGVHFDGTKLVATDKVSFVEIPFKIDVGHPITVPADLVGAVVPSDATCEISADTRLRICAAWDKREVFMTVNIYEKAFPNVDSVRQWADAPSVYRVSTSSLATALQRMRTLVGSERYPKVQMGFQGDMLVLDIWHDLVGHINDVVNVETVGDASDMVLWMNPDRVLDVCRAASGDTLTIGHNNEELKPVVFADDDDLVCVSMPMKATKSAVPAT